MSPSLPHLQRIFADIFVLPEEYITLHTSPDTLEAWDSLQHLNLMLAIEQEFGIQFTPEEMEQLVSVARIAECLDSKYPPAGNHV